MVEGRELSGAAPGRNTPLAEVAGASAPFTPSGVPFLDLRPMNSAVADDVLADLEALLESGAFTNGPAVAAFELAFASYSGAEECVGLASGLDALRLGLQALGVSPGDEVLVPAMTFVATFEAVSQVGAIPVPVDISALDYGMDPEAASAAITSRTRFILPVHLYGRVAAMEPLNELARLNDLVLLEDACQAHGAHREGFRAGTTGAAGAFSFYPGKNLGAAGDAGALVTDDVALASRVRALREHGQGRKYEHDSIGWTARLDTFQAAVLLRKLPLLDHWNAQRRVVADFYTGALSEVGDLVLPDNRDRGQVWHLFVVRTADPSALARHLGDRGIGTGRHYPEPPHLSKAYVHLGFDHGAFPVAEQLAREGLSLPIFPGMSEAQAHQVVEALRDWFDRGGR